MLHFHKSEIFFLDATKYETRGRSSTVNNTYVKSKVYDSPKKETKIFCSTSIKFWIPARINIRASASTNFAILFFNTLNLYHKNALIIFLLLSKRTLLLSSFSSYRYEHTEKRGTKYSPSHKYIYWLQLQCRLY